MIVHITDGRHGENLEGGRLVEVLDRAEASGVPVTVAVLGSGGCDEGRPDRRIAEVSGGRCLDAGDDVGASLHDEIARIGTGTTDAATAHRAARTAVAARRLHGRRGHDARPGR
ncbi:hypothetical protein ACFQV4_01885 [Streptomyces thermocarboxydus]